MVHPGSAKRKWVVKPWPTRILPSERRNLKSCMWLQVLNLGWLSVSSSPSFAKARGGYLLVDASQDQCSENRSTSFLDMPAPSRMGTTVHGLASTVGQGRCWGYHSVEWDDSTGLRAPVGLRRSHTVLQSFQRVVGGWQTQSRTTILIFWLANDPWACLPHCSEPTD